MIINFETLSLVEIVNTVSAVTGITPDGLRAKQKRDARATARLAIAHTARDAGYPYSWIGRALCIDHTSAIYAVRKCQNSPEAMTIVAQVYAALKNGPLPPAQPGRVYCPVEIEEAPVPDHPLAIAIRKEARTPRQLSMATNAAAGEWDNDVPGLVLELRKIGLYGLASRAYHGEFGEHPKPRYSPSPAKPAKEVSLWQWI